MTRRKKIPVFFPAGSVFDMDPDRIVADPFGSYTGLTEGMKEEPVQDADDL